jgi:MYXO-CTERM domain-containing protein
VVVNGVAAVPEPSTMLLAVVGLAAAALHRRRPSHADMPSA